MMTMEKAQKIIGAGIVKAKEIGQPMNIAVVDAGANLTAFARMDGAWLGSIDIAINKAFTAKAFDLSTLERQMNCTGCHFNGGGGMGPALMSGHWRYSGRIDQIYASIAQGRPNGMPSWQDSLQTNPRDQSNASGAANPSRPQTAVAISRSSIKRTSATCVCQ